jgi:hypothetical protein
VIVSWAWVAVVKDVRYEWFGYFEKKYLGGILSMRSCLGEDVGSDKEEEDPW